MKVTCKFASFKSNSSKKPASFFDFGDMCLRVRWQPQLHIQKKSVIRRGWRKEIKASRRQGDMRRVFFGPRTALSGSDERGRKLMKTHGKKSRDACLSEGYPNGKGCRWNSRGKIWEWLPERNSKINSKFYTLQTQGFWPSILNCMNLH